jgi:hypothetical protein
MCTRMGMEFSWQRRSCTERPDVASFVQPRCAPNFQTHDFESNFQTQLQPYAASTPMLEASLRMCVSLKMFVMYAFHRIPLLVDLKFLRFASFLDHPRQRMASHLDRIVQVELRLRLRLLIRRSRLVQVARIIIQNRALVIRER